MKKQPKFDYNDLLVRVDGRIEWTCPHGIGHTVFVPKQYDHIPAWWVHGCDGCCDGMKEAYIKWKESVRFKNDK